MELLSRTADPQQCARESERRLMLMVFFGRRLIAHILFAVHGRDDGRSFYFYLTGSI